MTVLVWIPEAGLEFLGELPPSVEVAPIPVTPENHPDLGQVQFFVPAIRTDYTSLIREMTSLQVVQSMNAGVDAVIPQIPEHVILCNARGVHDVPVSEWVVAAILGALKEFSFFHTEQINGRWTRHAVQSLAGAEVLLLGYGSIAQAVEKRLLPFGCGIRKVALHPRLGVESVDNLDNLLPDVDIVIVLVPLTSKTRHLIDAKAMRRMRPNAIIVNAARGPVIDTEALVSAIEEKGLRAVLDVTDPEPLPPDHALYYTTGAFITPHTAVSAGGGQREIFSGLITDQIKRYVNKESLINVISGDY
jgi:phosphoglycerate dehydrogenase-like enzyme